MSTNVSFCGMSIKIPEEKKEKDDLIKIAEFLGYPEKDLEEMKKGDLENIYELIYDNKKIKTWRLYVDSDSVIGLIYLVDDEYDVFDITYKMSLEEANVAIGELFEVLPKEFVDMKAENVNIFAYLYYNGSENPLTFN